MDMKDLIDNKQYSEFSSLFIDAIMTKDFTHVANLIADDAYLVVWDYNEFTGKEAVIDYWKGWLERWNEPKESTNYEVKFCNYYYRDVVSIRTPGCRDLYIIARIEDEIVKHLVLCPKPLQNPMIRYWSLDSSPLLFEKSTLFPHRMGKNLEAHKNRIPCMRCGCKSENLQWHEYTHKTVPLGYTGELSVCPYCMEAVEYFPTLLHRYDIKTKCSTES